MNQPGTNDEYPNWRLPLADGVGPPGPAGRGDDLDPGVLPGSDGERPLTAGSDLRSGEEPPRVPITSVDPVTSVAGAGSVPDTVMWPAAAHLAGEDRGRLWAGGSATDDGRSADPPAANARVAPEADPAIYSRSQAWACRARVTPSRFSTTSRFRAGSASVSSSHRWVRSIRAGEPSTDG